MPENRRRGAAVRAVARVSAVLGMLLLAADGVRSDDGEAWDRYRVFLWTFGDRKLDARFFGTLSALHVNGVNREGSASAEAVRQAGFAFYAGHAVTKSVLHLRRPVFEERWRAYRDHRTTDALVRPYCLNAPATRVDLRRALERAVKAHGADGPVAWSLGDEISITQRVTPIDFCFCPHCLSGFRSWLAARDGSVEALNARWRTRFESWSDVVPFTADRIKNRERRMPRGRRALGPWADHRAYMDRTLARTLARLRDHARTLGVRGPVGFLGGQAPAPYGGYDWGRLLPVVDWIEAYDQGGSMEVIRGLRPTCIRVRTYFKAGGGEELNRFRLWKYFAHGDRGAILWSDREFLDRKGAPTEYARALAPVLGRLTSAEAAEILPLPVAGDGVALYYSQASLRNTWFNDSRPDGRTWVNRFGSHEVKHSTHYRRREAWHRLLEDLGVQYTWVDARRVAAGGVPTDVKVLVLPEVTRMEPAELEAVRAFLRRGGRIMADRPGAELRPLVGHDRTTILRARMLRYLDFRRGGAGAEARGEVRAVLRRAGVEPVCRVLEVRNLDAAGDGEVGASKAGSSVGLEIVRRPAANGTFYFVLLNPTPAEEKAGDGAVWREPVRVKAMFRRPVRARAVFGDEHWEGSAIEHTMSGERPWIFFVEKP